MFSLQCDRSNWCPKNGWKFWAQAAKKYPPNYQFNYGSKYPTWSLSWGFFGFLLVTSFVKSMPASNRGIDAAKSAEPADFFDDFFEEPVIWVEGQKYTSVQYLGFNLLLGVAQHMLQFDAICRLFDFFCSFFQFIHIIEGIFSPLWWFHWVQRSFGSQPCYNCAGSQLLAQKLMAAWMSEKTSMRATWEVPKCSMPTAICAATFIKRWSEVFECINRSARIHVLFLIFFWVWFMTICAIQ